MAIKLYKENGVYYFENRVQPAGTCFLLIESDGKLTVKNVHDNEYIIQAQPVTSFVDSIGAPYADLGTFIAAVGDFFATVASSTISTNLISINGKTPGSFFGDNMVTTHRTPICAAKWSQGLPTFDCKITWIGDGGQIKVLDDLNNAVYHDGALSISTLTGANRGLFWTSNKKNRYLPGHVSFFGYTWSWHGLSAADGDFKAMVGAYLRGSVTSGRTAEIKEAIRFGFVRETGVLKFVLQVYKNYTLVKQKEIADVGIDYEILNIFEHQIGYYGTHPSIIWWFDAANKTTKLVDYTEFMQAFTSISDPNLSVGVWIENETNTTNIEIRNGSIEFGNYNTRIEPFDASARPVIDSISIATLAVDPIDTDGSGFLAAYKVLDSVSMPKTVTKTATTNGTFESSISNQLLSVSAAGINSGNKIVTLNIWFVPAADVTATFTPVRAGVNVLAKATTATVNFSNAILLAQFPVTANAQIFDVSGLQYLLSNGTVAVLSLVSTAAVTVTDIKVLLNTRDLF